ncbi:MAG: phosphohistidine phosphatase SixA [Terriglobales bacterium]
MLVYFLRHASAGDPKSDPSKDEKRPLDKDGVQQCGYVGRALALLETHVDLVISSPLKRATQTASLVANELAYESKIEISPALRPQASYAQFRDMLTRYENLEAIMVVGHNPNLSDFLGRVIGGGSGAAVDLKKGAVARVDVARHRGVLNWCVTPKVLRVLYEASAPVTKRDKSSRR